MMDFVIVIFFRELDSESHAFRRQHVAAGLWMPCRHAIRKAALAFGAFETRGLRTGHLGGCEP